jgi:flavin reductase (DIM6/NTAB) family NADH-FMN oxidoreductase RutF
MQKKQLGAKTLIYPMPVVIAGANVNGKPNFNAIAYCGVVQSSPAMISLSMDKKRYTNKGIKENNTFSINIPPESMVKITDYIGLYSGLGVDKSRLFKVFYGKLSTAPMIEECPINIECRLISVMDFNGKNDLFVGEVVETYSEDRYMTDGIPDIKKVNPILLSRYERTYWKVGEYLDKAWVTGKDYKP